MRVEFFAVDTPRSAGPFWTANLRFALETPEALLLLVQQCLTILTNAGWSYGFLVHDVYTTPVRRRGWGLCAAKGASSSSLLSSVQVFAQRVARPIGSWPEGREPLRTANAIVEGASDTEQIALYAKRWRADFDPRGHTLPMWGTRTYGWALAYTGRSDPARVTAQEMVQMDRLHAHGHFV